MFRFNAAESTQFFGRKNREVFIHNTSLFL